MKRILGYWLLILILAMAVFITVGYGDSAVENFDGMTDGAFESQMDQTWSVRQANPGDEVNISYLVSSEQSKSSPNSLKIVDNSSESAAIVRKAFPGAVSSGSYRVSVFLPADGTEESSYLTLANGTSSTNRYVDVFFTGKGELRYRTASDYTTVMEVKRDKWYDIEVTWGKNTFGLSVDGVAVVTNAAVINPENTPTLLEFKAGSNNKKSYFYIDDLTINY